MVGCSRWCRERRWKEFRPATGKLEIRRGGWEWGGDTRGRYGGDRGAHRDVVGSAKAWPKRENRGGGARPEWRKKEGARVSSGWGQRGGEENGGGSELLRLAFIGEDVGYLGKAEGRHGAGVERGSGRRRRCRAGAHDSRRPRLAGAEAAAGSATRKTGARRASLQRGEQEQRRKKEERAREKRKKREKGKGKSGKIQNKIKFENFKKNP